MRTIHGQPEDSQRHNLAFAIRQVVGEIVADRFQPERFGVHSNVRAVALRFASLLHGMYDSHAGIAIRPIRHQ